MERRRPPLHRLPGGNRYIHRRRATRSSRRGIPWFQVGNLGANAGSCRGELSVLVRQLTSQACWDGWDIPPLCITLHVPRVPRMLTNRGTHGKVIMKFDNIGKVNLGGTRAVAPRFEWVGVTRRKILFGRPISTLFLAVIYPCNFLRFSKNPLQNSHRITEPIVLHI